MSRCGQAFLRNQGLRFSQEEEIVPGCAVAGACPSCPEPPGPSRVIRNMLGWSQLEKTARVWSMVFRECPERREYLSSLCAARDWVKKGSYHTAWSVPWDSSCTCSYAYGRGPAIGPPPLDSSVGLRLVKPFFIIDSLQSVSWQHFHLLQVFSGWRFLLPLTLYSCLLFFIGQLSILLCL